MGKADTYISWIWHPKLGVYTLEGYARHRVLENSNPELSLIYDDGDEHEYFCPRGTALISFANKGVWYRRYDVSSGVRGWSDVPDVKEIDTTIRKRHKIPKSFVSSLYGKKRDWFNSVGYKMVGY